MNTDHKIKKIFVFKTWSLNSLTPSSDISGHWVNMFDLELLAKIYYVSYQAKEIYAKCSGGPK
jgi:hypothetical protein